MNFFTKYFLMNPQPEEEKPISRDDVEEKKKSGIMKRVFIIIGLMVAFFIVMVIIEALHRQKIYNEQQATRIDRAKVNMPSNPFAIWQSKTENDIKGLDSKIDNIEHNISNTINVGLKSFKEDISTNISSLSKLIDSSKYEHTQALNNAKSELSTKITQTSNEDRMYTDQKIASLNFNNINSGIGPQSLPSPKGKEKLPPNKQINPSTTETKQAIKSEPSIVEEDIKIPEELSFSTIDQKNQKPKEEKKEIQFDIPMGFAKATITTGANAAIFNYGKGDGSVPVYLSISTDVLLANNAVLNAKECMLLGGATGNLSDSRAEIRLSKISCILQDPKTNKTYKVEDKIEGWVYGEEGILGPVGRLVTQEGKIISAALPLAVLQTMMEYISSKANENTLYTAGSSVTGLTGYAAKGLDKGGNNVLDKISDIYIKYIESLNPVVSIRPGRTVVVAFKGTEKPLKAIEFSSLDVGYFERNENSTGVEIVNTDGNNYYKHSDVSGVEIYEEN